MSPARNAATTAATLLAIACLTMPGALPAHAADTPALRKDLTAVITLLGKPCGEVISVVGKADNDNIAQCKNGMRYRVFVNPEGRVVAQKQ